MQEKDNLFRRGRDIRRFRRHYAGIALMIAAGILICAVGGPLEHPIRGIEPERETAEETEAEEAPETMTEAEEEPDYAADRFNLALIWPEGADPTDPMQSFGGIEFNRLFDMDNAWAQTAFGAGYGTPAEAAKKMGRSVMGRYNASDSEQNPEDPSTWTIRKWTKITVDVRDGDGKPLQNVSNVKQILAMASVYTWYHDRNDTDAFRDYAEKLWKTSHFNRASMSEVYYDDGCLDSEKVAETQEKLGNTNYRLAERGEDYSIVSARDGSGAAVSDAEEEETTADAGSPADYATDSVRVINHTGEAHGPAAGTAGAASEAVQENALPQEPETMTAGADGNSRQSASEQAAEVSASGASAETSGGNESAAAAVSGAAASGTAGDGTAAAKAENGRKNGESFGDGFRSGEGGIAEDEASEDDEALPEGSSTDSSVYPNCPGHVDLHEKAVIYTMDGKKNLFTVDAVGNAEESKNDRWQGWTEQAMAEARTLAESDWYADYGLSANLLTKTAFLGAEEIAKEMALLPADLSEDRRKLAETALGSIGRIPYYFGGKPVSALYEGNSFGSIVEPDYKGRVFRGLDCSGWVSWVYWNALGMKFSEQGTGGLIHLGRGIRRNELKTGDLIVRSGNESTIGHVMMFLRWGSDGEAVCVHCTGGVTNNVCISNNTDYGASCRDILGR
ncbi:NlpC/P60 family protein [[Clostridium] aminophilum]|uniref:NlpC/P60 family protein n=1 Tax=[Clostridium] aminophilum TaxID=1526 RepID=UPI00332265D8